MGIFDGTRTAGWDEKPNFPVGRGQWTPMTLFALAARINVTPETTLALLAEVIAELNLDVNSNTDLITIFNQHTDLEVISATETALNKIAGFHLSLDLQFNSMLFLSSPQNDLDIIDSWGISTATDLATLADLAVSQGLLVESEIGLLYVGVENLGSEAMFGSDSALTIARSLNLLTQLQVTKSSGLKKIARLTTSKSLSVSTSTTIELIQLVREIGLLKSGTQAGTGTGWMGVSNIYEDPARAGWGSLQTNEVAYIDAKYAPYYATANGKCSHSGGTVPMYGQTQFYLNDVLVATGAQQSASPGTSSVSYTGTFKGLDKISWQWRGEGNFFNRPVLQSSGTWFRITPQQ